MNWREKKRVICVSFVDENNLSTFLCMPSKRIYTSLVKIIFSNIHLTDGILQSKLRNHRISLSVEEFVEMLNLHHEDKIIERRDKVNRYNYNIISSFYERIIIMHTLPFHFLIHYNQT